MVTSWVSTLSCGGVYKIWTLAGPWTGLEWTLNAYICSQTIFRIVYRNETKPILLVSCITVLKVHCHGFHIRSSRQ